MSNVDPAQVTALITALAGLVTAVGAVLHSIHTKRTVTARSQEAAQDFLTSDETRAALGRQVRSTAKDALQDLTEAAGQPFVIPPPEPTGPAPSMIPAPVLDPAEAEANARNFNTASGRPACPCGQPGCQYAPDDPASSAGGSIPKETS